MWQTTTSGLVCEDCNAGFSKQADHETMAAMKASIIAEIKGARMDVKKEVGEATGQLKRELPDFREELNEKLSVIDTYLKEMGQRIEKTERRVSKMEAFGADVKDVLPHTLELQEHLQAWLIDLEARSRRNNMRIHSIHKGAEGNNMQEFIYSFIKAELALPDIQLRIQRCHHSLCPKPLHESNLRCVVRCFLEFKTKELVLQSAWPKKDIQYKGRHVL